MAKSGYDSKKGLGLANNLKPLRRRASKLIFRGISSNLTQSKPEAISNLPQPPFLHLLSSNIPPTESQASLVRDVIVTAHAEESRLKEMVLEMVATHTSGSQPLSTRRTLAKLDSDIGRTHQFIIDHEAIVSVVRRIPPDILHNIFIYTLPDAIKFSTSDLSLESLDNLFYLTREELPWALSQVCQLWRTIILSSSVMWQCLPCIRLDDAHTRKKPYLGCLAEMLKRSRNMPIRFAIAEWDKFHSPHPVIDMLIHESNRWQQVFIIGTLTLLRALQKIKDRLASLQSLIVELDSKNDIIDPTVHDLFQIAPQLRHVDRPGLGEFLLPTHQLRYYSQNGGSFSQVIFSSPDLRVLKLKLDDGGDIEGMLTSTPYEFPHLTTLNASKITFLSHKQFFNNITLPAIEELELRFDVLDNQDADNQDAIIPIRSMILRSHSPCLLRILNLDFHGTTPSNLPSLLKLTPFLTILKVTLPPTDDISALIFDGRTLPLVPFLKECHFLHRGFPDPPPMRAIQVLKLLALSRCELHEDPISSEMLLSGKIHTLERFHISFGHIYRRYFDGWVFSDMAHELCKQRKRLLKMVPEITHYSDIPPLRKFDLTWKNKVIGVLTYLETLRIEKASDICVSIRSVFYFPSYSVRFSCLQYIMFSTGLPEQDIHLI